MPFTHELVEEHANADIAHLPISKEQCYINHFALSQDSCLGAVNRHYIPKSLNALNKDYGKPGCTLQRRCLNSHTYSSLRLVPKTRARLVCLWELAFKNSSMINSPKLSQTTSPCPNTRAWGAVDCQYIPKRPPKGLLDPLVGLSALHKGAKAEGVSSPACRLYPLL